MLTFENTYLGTSLGNNTRKKKLSPLMNGLTYLITVFHIVSGKEAVKQNNLFPYYN